MTDREPRFEDAHQQRLDAWRRDSRALSVTDENTLVLRFSLSRRPAALLPHPALLPHEQASAHAQHQAMLRRSLALGGAGLALSLVGALSPTAVRLVVWSLALGLFIASAVAARSARLIEAQTYVKMKGPLAEAWFAWNDATARIHALDGAVLAREALGANEARMSQLVLELARAEESGSTALAHESARAWVLSAAAKATLLADAATVADAQAKSQIEAHHIDLAPDGDLGALDRALGQIKPS